PADSSARRWPYRRQPAAQSRRLALREARALGPSASGAAASDQRAERRSGSARRGFQRPDPRPRPLMYETRVLSGMRPTGSLHLGHYHGVLKNWSRLQAEYPCLFFVADWHALTTDYAAPGDIARS